MARPPAPAALALVAVAAGAFPAVAAAHARFVRSVPPDRAVLGAAPKEVQVFFDDDVRVAGGNAAVLGGGGSVLAGPGRVVGGRRLVLPLRPGLRQGDYSIRWSIISDDGHREQGVLAFAVGAGRSPPVPSLTPASPVEAGTTISRALWILGVLLTGGAALFSFVPGAAATWRQLFTGFLLAFLGASSLGHSAGGTRFGLVLDVGAAIAIVGSAAAALSTVDRRATIVARVAGLALLPLPTLGGHALDPGRPRVLSAAIDVVHVGAAAAWLGGLAVLVSYERPSSELVRRFSRLAFWSVLLLAAAGAGRALVELTAVSQLWASGYGQAILVKTALFAVTVGLGWLNRSRLLDALERLRLSMAGELVLLLGVVAAVAVLTELRPGRQAARAAAGEAVSAPAKPKPRLPPPGTPTLARQARDVAVGLTLGRGATVTLLGPDGNAYAASSVRIDGTAARRCGVGCWRVAHSLSGRVRVQAAGLPAVTFPVPARPRPAARLAREAAAAFRRLSSVSVQESLASGPGPPQRSRQRAERPDRFSYAIAGGPQGIVIGSRRWDRPTPTAAWQRSVQDPRLRQPAPLWSAASRNAFVVASDRRTETLALLDPTLPAWFEIRVDRSTKRPLGLRMTAASHFMTDRYGQFDTPRRISPPR